MDEILVRATQPLRRLRRIAREAPRNATEAAYRALRGRIAKSPWGISETIFAMTWFRARPNFGDALSPLVMQAQTGLRPTWVTPNFPGKVLSVGSILHYLQPGDLVVGSGLIKPERIRLPDRARVVSVRGPLTAELLGLDAQSVLLGDPGSLAPQVLGIQPSASARGVGLIPHYWEKDESFSRLRRMRTAVPVTFIDAQQAPEKVIRQIASCEVCVSTSLHGIIVAEALGIPAIWAEVTGKLIGGNFKFTDYYLGTGRVAPDPLPLEEAIDAAFARQAERFILNTEPILRALGTAALLLRAEL